MNKIKLFILALPLLALMIGTVTADAVTTNVTVNSFLTATFNYNTVSYGSLNSGTANQTAPNQATGVYNVTISTNTPFKIQSSGTTFTDGGSHTFTIDNLRMDTDTVAGSLALGNSVGLTGSLQTIDTGVSESTTTDYNGFWLSIPAGQYATSYSSTLTVTYSVV
jgi:hypothetical protein